MEIKSTICSSRDQVHQVRLAAVRTEPTPATWRFLDDEADLVDLGGAPP
jgi:hypothetical protein